MSTDSEGLPDEEIISDHIAAEEAVPLAVDSVSSVLQLSIRRVMPLVGMGSVNLIFMVETDLKAFDLTRWAIDRCPARIEEIAASAGRCVTTMNGTQR